jgi:beta-lactamase class A
VDSRRAEPWRRWGIPILCLLVGGGVGSLLNAALSDGGCRTFTEVRDEGYRYISPLLECDSDREVFRNRELRPFKGKVEAALRGLLAAPGIDAPAPDGGVESASVYFRELNDGLWFSINEELAFEPASMRKIPMLIALLKQAERTPGLLERRVAVELPKDLNAAQEFKPTLPVELGRTYLVGDLLSRMIVGSDNNAFAVLGGLVEREELGKVYGLLGMRPPSGPREQDGFTVLSYGAYFRILYNGTYLSKESSERVLELMTEVEFRAGLVAGVGRDVAVAHKFGERTDAATGERQLHDCGIVYYPRHPYLLCVMTRGRGFDDLAGAIATISRTVFEQVDDQHDHAARLRGR